MTTVGESSGGYDFTARGIAWPNESKKYGPPGYPLSQIVPPPNWAATFPDGYNASNLPNLQTDEHFQNWMRTAGLPTFTKLYGRNDSETLLAGTYQVQIDLSALKTKPDFAEYGTDDIFTSDIF